MEKYLNRWILTGWGLFILSVFVPWSTMLYGKPMAGWFWMVMDFFPFYYVVTLTEIKAEHISSYLLSLSIIFMVTSPLLLYLLNRTYNKWYAYPGIVCLPLAIGGFVFEFFVPKQLPPPDSVTGYLLYVCACALLAVGFVKQMLRVSS